MPPPVETFEEQVIDEASSEFDAFKVSVAAAAQEIAKLTQELADAISGGSSGSDELTALKSRVDAFNTKLGSPVVDSNSTNQVKTVVDSTTGTVSKVVLPQGGDNIPVTPPPVVTPATPQVLGQGQPLASTIDPNAPATGKPTPDPIVPDPSAGVPAGQDVADK